MANEVNIYTPRYLAEVVRQAPPVHTFFRDTFFTNVQHSPTESVDIDIVKGNRRMAAFVHPRIGGEVLKSDGYKTESYKPPLVNPYDETTADRYMTRMPGEDLYSGMTPAQRAAKKLMGEYASLNDATTRREEWMAVQAIVTGQIPIVGKGVNEIIDFGFTNTETLTGTAQWGKHRLKIHYYIRYMDDVIILGQDKETLHRWKAAVETFLREELALDLNSKTSIRPVRQGVEFVGVRIWPTHMKLRKSTVRRIKREVRKISALYAAGDMTRQDFYRRIASIRGLLKHTESASLRWRLNEIYRAELEKAKQKQLREEAQHEPFADHSGAGNGDGNAGTGYQDHGNPACRAG